MPRPRNPVDSLGVVAPLATRWIERVLAAHDPPLTLAQFLALRAIESERLAAAELARRAGVSGAAVSQLVASLEARGWIEREPESDDRRRQTLALSPDGARVLAAAARLLRARLGGLLGALPRREADALGHALDRLGAALGASPPPRRPPRPPRPEAPRPPRR